jgi:hypothetical protein
MYRRRIPYTLRRQETTPNFRYSEFRADAFFGAAILRLRTMAKNMEIQFPDATHTACFSYSHLFRDRQPEFRLSTFWGLLLPSQVI